MSFFKEPLFRCEAYTTWVRTLPCANCAAHPPSAPHHRIGHGRNSAMKTSDAEVMPLCDECHQNLHNIGWRQWEEANRPQFQMVVETINKALFQGVLEVNKKVAKELSYE